MYTKHFCGHTIEVRGCGTGSVDPWTLDFAQLIDCSIMCTSDLGTFMRIDGDAIYKFQRHDLCIELHELLDKNIIETWEMFLNEWLNPLITKRQVEDFGSLKESIERTKRAKQRDNVWKSYPPEKRRDLYEYLKTLSREEANEWFSKKIKELEEKTV